MNIDEFLDKVGGCLREGGPGTASIKAAMEAKYHDVKVRYEGPSSDDIFGTTFYEYEV